MWMISAHFMSPTRLRKYFHEANKQRYLQSLVKIPSLSPVSFISKYCNATPYCVSIKTSYIVIVNEYTDCGLYLGLQLCDWLNRCT